MLSLTTSRFTEFDHPFAERLRRDHPDLWALGGTKRGNPSYRMWGRARRNSHPSQVHGWLKDREAWAARHQRSHRLPDIIAMIKRGICGECGMATMRRIVLAAIQKKKMAAK